MNIRILNILLGTWFWKYVSLALFITILSFFQIMSYNILLSTVTLIINNRLLALFCLCCMWSKLRTSIFIGLFTLNMLFVMINCICLSEYLKLSLSVLISQRNAEFSENTSVH